VPNDRFSWASTLNVPDLNVLFTILITRRNSMKAAIVVLSDPKSTTEEALGEVFNALALPTTLNTMG